MLTGRGASLKPDEALSDIQRQAVNDWFDHTLYGRLNDKKNGCIILIMQRLHQGFLVTNLSGRSRSVFSFYNDRGECENRIEEFKNGFAADRLSRHHFRANAFRLLLHSFAYNLVNLFRLRLPSSMRSAQIETLRIQLFKIGARIRQTARCVRIHLASGWPFQDLFQAASVCNSS